MIGLRLAVAVIGFGLAGSTGFAQNGPEGGGANEVVSNGGVVNTLVAAPVIGQPFSAVRVQRSTQKLADGTTISHQGHHFVARDAEGRVRVELRVGKTRSGEEESKMVFVSDPVAHTITIWTTGPKANKVASVVKIPADKTQPPTVQPNAAAESSRPQPVVTTENLGTQTMQALPVSDVRTTTIVPAGRSGNDAPITKMREVWTSEQMKLVMKEQWEDPRTGERTVELEDFSRSAPDPALFRTPPDYTVKSVLESLKELEEKLGATQN